MNAVGIIAEYNPFHNGHLYHLNKVKEMYPDDVIILVLGGNFLQRGESSIINKWDKTDIALHYGVDIVIELPFPFATQAADIFAKGSIQILNAMNVKALIFGSETNDIDKLKNLANIQLHNKDYQDNIRKYLDEGENYPTALSKASFDVTDKIIDSPNDILGLSYIKEIIKQKANIEPITIKRTNDYHSLDVDGTIASATSIRNILKNKGNVEQLVPKETLKYLSSHPSFIENYFPYLKYQILNNLDKLEKFQTVDEGIENRIKKYIVGSTTLDELVSKVKTKRYTCNRIKRMLTHIMCNFTKEEANNFKNVSYLRVLGFSHKGQLYLNRVKKVLALPLITKFNKENDKMLDLELRTTCVYATILDEHNKNMLIKEEYSHQYMDKQK